MISVRRGETRPTSVHRGSLTSVAHHVFLFALAPLVTGCPELLPHDFTTLRSGPVDLEVEINGTGGEVSSTAREENAGPTGAGAEKSGSGASASSSNVGGTRSASSSEVGGNSASARGGSATSGASVGTATSGAAGEPAGGAPSLDAGATLDAGMAPAGSGGDGAGGMGGVGGTGGSGGSGEDECTAEERQAADFCGCEATPSADCNTLRSELVVRYTFDGTGATVNDQVGFSDAEVVNGVLDGNGGVTLGETVFVSVPDYMASDRNDATFEVWLTWNGGAARQRIFNFGNRDAANEQHYIALTPKHAAVGGRLELTFTSSGQQSQVSLQATQALPTERMSHVAVVVNDSANRLAIYVDGTLESSSAFYGTLSALKDTTNWIGRSVFDADPYLDAVMHELRVYGAALTADEIATSAALGPDAEFLQP